MINKKYSSRGVMDSIKNFSTDFWMKYERSSCFNWCSMINVIQCDLQHEQYEPSVIHFSWFHYLFSDQGPTCEVRVKRNTIWNAVPQKALTINCPVRHCGEKLHATWCKFVDLLNCEQIHETEQVTFGWRQKDILILDFKKISINDDGLYRCGVAENGSTTVSHAIKVSVSGNQPKLI